MVSKFLYNREEEFEAELMYRMSLSVAKSMLKKDLVTEEEYRQIDTMLLEKYQPILGTLLAGKSYHHCDSKSSKTLP